MSLFTWEDLKRFHGLLGDVIARHEGAGEKSEKPAKPAKAAAAPPAPKPEPITQDTVRKAATPIVETHGARAVIEILAPFGVKKISQLTDDQLPAVLAAVQSWKPAEPESEDPTA